MNEEVKAYLDFLDSAKANIPCYDASHEGNSAKYHTGKPCAFRGCEKPAGTLWAADLCFEHNVERMRRIDGSKASG